MADRRRAATTDRVADRRFGVRAILTFIAVLLVAVPGALLVIGVRERVGFLLDADEDTADTLHRFALRHHAFTTTMKAISAVGSPLGWWIVLTPVFVWLLVRRRTRLAAFVAITAIGSSLLNTLIKTVVDRARPHLVDPLAVAAGKSFPSGHTQAATVGCGILVLIFLPLVRRQWRPWLWIAGAVVTVLIGFSRIALGVHFISDVLGAIVIGSAWLLAMTAAFSAWRRDRHRRPVELSEGLEPDARR